MLPPDLPDRASALFFDFDGTLVELAPQPEAVHVDPALPGELSRLGGLLGGALAIVSGRPLADIDHHLALPPRFGVAGVHGAERRGADGVVRRMAVPPLDAALAPVQALAERHPMLRLERKPAGLALHYRQAPALEDACLAAMSEALARSEGMALMHGKMVVEIKPRRASKGAAVRSFLDERPFRHRRPWFFGDDVTDEAAFEFVLSVGGVAVKVGPGESLATHRLADPAAVRGWIARATSALAETPVERVSP
ncbi:trehalose-phosphatase [Piscinibacter sakaiensis]|uniref:Trehalose 6-phosphate phosphatase n=2 Tax=Piscinibacter sakaiensis TaxID=1547922 RepID=A0A0K8NVB3_PISS1|nr:trehalose-phosphatase [Piscinibacter sakaiensis]GAP34336.1 trehalose-6-phosphate phosphatase [Piscinibacter sakaiensis]